MSAAEWASRLASGEVIEAPVGIVVAHPDDETLWTGSVLRRLPNATLVLLTDGAPEDMADAHRLGFSSREGYARCRAAELARALDALEFRGRLVRYDLPDQAAVDHLGAIAARLAIDLAEAPCILTHAYEGGHPDHDAAALAVSLLGRPVVEFAAYAQFDGTRIFGRFVNHPEAPEHQRPLTPEDRARVEAALAAHASQASVFGRWRPTTERWRPAPTYRFDTCPPGEACLYDSFGWALTSAEWRRRAAMVLEAA